MTKHDELNEIQMLMPSKDANAESAKTSADGLDRRIALRMIESLFGTVFVVGCGGGGSTTT